MIEFVNVAKYFDNGNVALKDLNFKINENDILSIIGPSGAGKSTLLSLMILLTSPTSGKILFHGEEIFKNKKSMVDFRKKIGMVFQEFYLFDHMSVIENVMIPQIDLLKRTSQEACDEAMKYLRLVGMAEKKFSYPNELSGGEKQRVAIARTLAMDPEIILFDEPTSALDPAMASEVKQVIKKLASLGKTMVIVSHDIGFVREVSTRVIFIDENTIIEDGSKSEIFSNPKNELTRRFIERLKTLEFTVASKDFDFFFVTREIKEFGERFSIDIKKVKKLQLLFEELCVQILLKYIEDEINIKFKIEYSDEKNKIILKFSHTGKEILKNVPEDNISMMIIEGLKKDIDIIEEIGE